MTLAGMLAFNRTLLICDMAETYPVLDIWGLPVPLLAALASGLREDSRIKLAMAGMQPIPITALLARLSDDLALFRYGFTKDAEKGKNKPLLFVDLLMDKAPDPKDEIATFDSGEDFTAEWERIKKEVATSG